MTFSKRQIVMLQLRDVTKCLEEFYKPLVPSFVVPLACLGSEALGSMAGTPVELSENSFQNLLYQLLSVQWQWVFA